MALSLRSVNKAIKVAGIDATLIRGEGYFYFVGDAVSIDAPSVYVYRINNQTISEWIAHARTSLNPDE